MSNDSRTLIEQYIGRPADSNDHERDTPVRHDDGTASRSRRLWQVLAAHLRGLQQAGVLDDRSTISIASALEHISDRQQSGASLRRMAISIEERVDGALPAELQGAVMLGLAYEEWTATAVRLGLRSDVLIAGEAAITMQGALIEVARQHAVTLMQGFKDGRPVQPITFGHMLGGAIAPVGGAIGQLGGQFDRLNRSPLGAGTMSGEVVGAEREETASWLGFDTPIPNTFDAVANVEDVIATLKTVASIASPIDRLLDELLKFLRTDPASLVLDDAWIGEDSQMPGHRSPERLIGLRRDLNALDSETHALIVRLRQMPYGPLGEALDGIEDAGCDLLRRAGRFFAEVEALFRTSLTVNRAWLANRAGRGYTTASDLAAFLMTEESLSPLDARNIASLVLRRLREENTEMSGITAEVVDTAAMLVIGRELKVEVETLGRWFAPRRFLERRLVEGSPAPSKTREWLEGEWDQNEQSAAEFSSRRQRVRDAEKAMWRWVEERAAESND